MAIESDTSESDVESIHVSRIVDVHGNLFSIFANDRSDFGRGIEHVVNS